MSNRKLLTMAVSSPKLAKFTGDKYIGAILYLASAVYDRRLCPNAGECMKSCLIVHAGRAAIGGPDNTIQRARKWRSDLLLNERTRFIQQLHDEIRTMEFKAMRLGKQLVVRLNGGSDLDWSETYKVFRNVQFWEYTKRPELAMKLQAYSNVHVTYSYNERTTTRIFNTIHLARINTAVVFNVKRKQPLPATYRGIPVIDGDLHDYRFLDPKGVIVGLRLKSLRKVDSNSDKLKGGFVMSDRMEIEKLNREQEYYDNN